MDATDLAFAGAARQARLIAAGEVSARELVERDARPHRAPRPAAQRLPRRLRRARARRGRPGRRAGAAPATRGRCSACRSRSRTTPTSRARSTARGTDASDRAPRPRDAEVVRRLRAAGAVVIGKTHVPELMIWPFTESPSFGVTRNPWALDRTPGGSSGGFGAAVAAGLRGVALGYRRRRLDPHPGRAAAACSASSPSAAACRSPPHERRLAAAMTVGGADRAPVADAALFLDAVADGRPRGRLRRGRRARARHACGSRSRRRCRRCRGAARARAARRRRGDRGLLRSLGHEVVEREIAYGASGAANVVPRYLRGIHDEAAVVAHPERLTPRTRAMARLGGADPAGRVARARGARGRRRPRASTRSSPTPTCSCTPGPARAAAAASASSTAAARCWTLNAVAAPRALLRRVQRHGPAGALGARRLRRRRPPARRPARRAAARRGDAALARRPDRGRAAVGRSPAAAVSERPLDVALEAARGGGRRRSLDSLRAPPAAPEGVEAKSTPTDLVSDADLEAERADPRGPRPPPPRRRDPRRGGRRRRGHDRAALGRRPARRHDQLPVRAARSGRSASRASRPGRRRARPAARRGFTVVAGETAR